MHRGRPPTPTYLRLLRGNPGKRALPKGEPQPMTEPECPAPPSYLGPYACEEWRQIAPELHRIGLLTVCDTACFAAYCVAYQRWRTAEEVLARIAANDPYTHGLLVRRDGSVSTNPLVRIAAKSAEDMVRFAGEFGLTPVARARIAAGVVLPPGASKFDGLLAGR